MDSDKNIEKDRVRGKLKNDAIGSFRRKGTHSWGKSKPGVEKRYTNLNFKNKTIDFSLQYRYDGNVRFFDCH